jgi:hypothetical protein
VDFLFVIATKAYAPALIILASEQSRMELAFESAPSREARGAMGDRHVEIRHNPEWNRHRKPEI